MTNDLFESLMEKAERQARDLAHKALDESYARMIANGLSFEDAEDIRRLQQVELANGWPELMHQIRDFVREAIEADNAH